MGVVNDKAFVANGYKQKMESEFSELNSKRTTERRRLEAVTNAQRTIQSHEKELEELTEKGIV